MARKETDKKRVSTSLDPAYHDALQELSDNEGRSLFIQAERLLIGALDAAAARGDISPIKGSATDPMEMAIAICHSYAKTNDGTVSTSFVMDTAKTLGVEGADLIKRCQSEGLKPKKNGNGTSTKVEVKA